MLPFVEPREAGLNYYYCYYSTHFGHQNQCYFYYLYSTHFGHQTTASSITTTAHILDTKTATTIYYYYYYSTHFGHHFKVTTLHWLTTFECR